MLKFWWNEADILRASGKFMSETYTFIRWISVKCDGIDSSIDGLVMEMIPQQSPSLRRRMVPVVLPFVFKEGDYIVFSRSVIPEYAGHIARIVDPGNGRIDNNVFTCAPPSPHYPDVTEFIHKPEHDAQYRIHSRFVELAGWGRSVRSSLPSGVLACPQCMNEITRYYRGCAPFCPTCNIFQSSDGHGKPGAWLIAR